jgi:hypothetical protein
MKRMIFSNIILKPLISYLYYNALSMRGVVLIFVALVDENSSHLGVK